MSPDIISIYSYLLNERSEIPLQIRIKRLLNDFEWLGEELYTWVTLMDRCIKETNQ